MGKETLFPRSAYRQSAMGLDRRPSRQELFARFVCSCKDRREDLRGGSRPKDICHQCRHRRTGVLRGRRKGCSRHVRRRGESLFKDHPDSPEKLWEKENNTGYEIAPTALVEKDGVLFIPTCKGSLVAMSSEDGEFLWAHKLSIGLVNPLKVWRRGRDMRILTTTMDGKVTLLSVPASYNMK